MLEDADGSATASSRMRDEGADEPTPLPGNLCDAEIGARCTRDSLPRWQSAQHLPSFCTVDVAEKGTFAAARMQRLRRWQSLDPPGACKLTLSTPLMGRG
jgi:hypothetical protein